MPKRPHEASPEGLEDPSGNNGRARKKGSRKAKPRGWQTPTNKTAQCDECYKQHQSCTGWRCERCAKNRLYCTKSNDGTSCEECNDAGTNCSGVRSKCQRCEGLKKKVCLHDRIRKPDLDHILVVATRINPQIEKEIIAALRTDMKRDEGEGGQAEVTGEQYLIQADGDRRKALRKKWKQTELYQMFYDEPEEPQADNAAAAAAPHDEPIEEEQEWEQQEEEEQSSHDHPEDELLVQPSPMQNSAGTFMEAQGVSQPPISTGAQQAPMGVNFGNIGMPSGLQNINHGFAGPGQISQGVHIGHTLEQEWQMGPGNYDPSGYQAPTLTSHPAPQPIQHDMQYGMQYGMDTHYANGAPNPTPYDNVQPQVPHQNDLLGLWYVPDPYNRGIWGPHQQFN